MKTKMFFSSLAIILLSLAPVFAQPTSKTMKVYGKCSLCETRIEKAAKSVSGVSSADWNAESQMLSFSFDASKTNMEKVQAAILAAGHDTDMKRTSDKSYKALPKCCQYERPAMEMPEGCTMHKGE